MSETGDPISNTDGVNDNMQDNLLDRLLMSDDDEDDAANNNVTEGEGETKMTEQFTTVLLTTLTDLNKLIETTQDAIHQATTKLCLEDDTNQLEKIKSLTHRLNELEGRKISAETSLDLLKNPVVVPPKRKEELKTNEEPNCCVCMVKTANAIAIPCGHLCCCLGCLNKVENGNGNCPMCRSKITSIQQVHQSVSRKNFKTDSQALAEPFSAHGITRVEARVALDSENGNVSDAGHRLFKLALDRDRSKQILSKEEQHIKGTELKNQGNAFLKDKANDEALECYKQAINVCPDGESSHIFYANAAEALTRLYRYEEAVQMCGLSIRRKDDYFKSHSKLGKALIEMGHQEGAIKSLNRALALVPGNASVKTQLAKAHAMNGGTNNARPPNVAIPNMAAMLQPGPLQQMMQTMQNDPQIMQMVGTLQQNPQFLPAAEQMAQILASNPATANLVAEDEAENEEDYELAN